MERGFALQQVNLEALAESHLEYIADPTICFPHSRLVARTDLCVAAGASAVLSESYLWHDPRGTDVLAFDTLSMETAIRRPDGHSTALFLSLLTSARGLWAIRPGSASIARSAPFRGRSRLYWRHGFGGGAHGA